MNSRDKSEPGQGLEPEPAAGSMSRARQNPEASVEPGGGRERTSVIETRFAYREPLKDKYPRLAGVSEEIVRCIKCGMCRAVCPTLIETVSESQGARGRVSLIEAVLDGRLSLSDIFEDRISTCLNCKACIEACPSGVRVDDVILAARAELVSRGRFSFLKRLILRGLLKRGRLLPPVGKMASALQRMLLALSPKGSALRLLLPTVRINKERRLPVFASRAFTEQVPPRVAAGSGLQARPGEARPGERQHPERSQHQQLRVAYFAGCAANLIYTNIAFSTVDVLSRLGVEVLVPKEVGCCGMPVLNAGDFVTARGMALKNVKILKRLADLERVDAIVISCASCGLSLKREYSRVLGIDTTGLSGLVMDVSEFIVKKVGLNKLRALLETATKVAEARSGAGESAGEPGGGEAAGAREATETEEAPRALAVDELVVTYHDPCHLRRGQGIKDEPREIIRILPGVKLVEMSEPDRCCGGAGLYSFTQYEMSKAIVAHKVRSIIDTGAEVVLTACASCIMQIEDALRQAGCTQRVMHVMELVSEMLHGAIEKRPAAVQSRAFR